MGGVLPFAWSTVAAVVAISLGNVLDVAVMVDKYHWGCSLSNCGGGGVGRVVVNGPRWPSRETIVRGDLGPLVAR